MTNEGHKDLNIIGGVIRTPPMSVLGRAATGFYLRKLQAGEMLSLPISRPMPSIGASVHELRIMDTTGTWRIIYRIGETSIDVVEVFAKKTQKTPKQVIDRCQRRLRALDL